MGSSRVLPLREVISPLTTPKVYTRPESASSPGPAHNAAPASAENFLITSQELIQCQRCGRERRFEILGIYHSHPDQPANPSEQDVRLACWTNCSYVVLSVEDGVLTVLRSFAARMETGKPMLLEEAVKIEREVVQPDAAPV